MPRLGIEPRLEENDSVSEVKLSSRRLSPGAGWGSGNVCFCGRKIVLKPMPIQVPSKAASGPSGGGGGAAARAAAPCRTAGALGRTSWILKSFGMEKAGSRRSAILMLHKLLNKKSFWRLFGRCISHNRRWRFSHLLHPPLRGQDF